MAVALGLLPPYRLGVTADPTWMDAFATHADAVGFESLLGEGTDAALAEAARCGAARVVLSTRTADLDVLRRDMDAAVAAVARLN